MDGDAMVVLGRRRVVGAGKKRWPVGDGVDGIHHLRVEADGKSTVFQGVFRKGIYLVQIIIS